MHSNRDLFSVTAGREQSTFDWVDGVYMDRALRLSWLAAGQTDPNPLVGALVVKDGAVIGEGYHHRCGEAHAEVVALDEAGSRARGGTLYVTLEPCAHHGRTPPCVDRIVAAGVRRVVVPTLDPDEKVLGRGARRLRQAGIRVDAGCRDAAGITTNLGYYKQRLGMDSTVVLKMAVTLDGKIASARGRRDDVTGESARRFAHRLRAASDGIVVGLGTVLTDAPLLDCRLIDCGAHPTPVVLDGLLEVPENNRWSSAGTPYVVVGGGGAPAARKAALTSRGGRIVECPSDPEGRVDICAAVRGLAGAGLRRLLVEGGAGVFTSFLRAGLWDAMYLFHSLKAFGREGVSAIAGSGATTLDAVSVDAVRLGADFLHRYLRRATYEEITARLSKARVGREADGRDEAQ